MTSAATSSVEASYQVQLDVFEGPLDLLLHLVKKHELDIFDVPISFITEKYLAYLDLMSALQLDVAGEYLLMAATLAHIKSRELLPSPPPLEAGEGDEDGDDDGDSREELIRRLLEYQKYRAAAESLGGRPVVGRNVWMRGAPQEEALAENVNPEVQPPLAEVSVMRLIEALDRVLSRAKVRIAHEVNIDRLSVTQCINQLVDRLEREGSFTFTSCFRFLREEVTPAEARNEAVTTFLAVLEMARLGVIRLWQGHDGELEEDIVIARAGAAIQPTGDIDGEYR
jgi:segregation and condensation protein A